MPKEKTISDKFDYEIDCYTETDYRLLLTFWVQNRIMKLIFTKAIKTKKLKDRVNGKADYEKLDSFIVPQNYLNLLRSAINKPLITVRNIFREDGIMLLTDGVTKGVYIREGGKKWKICITVEGIYQDKR